MSPLGIDNCHRPWQYAVASADTTGEHPARLLNELRIADSLHLDLLRSQRRQSRVVSTGSTAGRGSFVWAWLA